MESEEDARAALAGLASATFEGQPVRARLKSESIIKSLLPLSPASSEGGSGSGPSTPVGAGGPGFGGGAFFGRGPYFGAYNGFNAYPPVPAMNGAQLLYPPGSSWRRGGERFPGGPAKNGGYQGAPQLGGPSTPTQLNGGAGSFRGPGNGSGFPTPGFNGRNGFNAAAGPQGAKGPAQGAVGNGQAPVPAPAQAGAASGQPGVLSAKQRKKAARRAREELARQQAAGAQQAGGGGQPTPREGPAGEDVLRGKDGSRRASGGGDVGGRQEQRSPMYNGAAGRGRGARPGGYSPEGPDGRRRRSDQPDGEANGLSSPNASREQGQGNGDEASLSMSQANFPPLPGAEARAEQGSPKPTAAATTQGGGAPSPVSSQWAAYAAALRDPATRGGLKDFKDPARSPSPAEAMAAQERDGAPAKEKGVVASEAAPVSKPAAPAEAPVAQEEEEAEEERVAVDPAREEEEGAVGEKPTEEPAGGPTPEEEEGGEGQEGPGAESASASTGDDAASEASTDQAPPSKKLFSSWAAAVINGGNGLTATIQTRPKPALTPQAGPSPAPSVKDEEQHKDQPSAEGDVEEEEQQEQQQHKEPAAAVVEVETEGDKHEAHQGGEPEEDGENAGAAKEGGKAGAWGGSKWAKRPTFAEILAQGAAEKAAALVEGV
jgi:hypothetical protein